MGQGSVSRAALDAATTTTPAQHWKGTYGSTSAGSISISSFIQAGFLALRLVRCSSAMLPMGVIWVSHTARCFPH